MNFDNFNFHPSITEGIRMLGYVTPTPIQNKAIPLIMQGHDIIGLAQTGTGKTAAFALPVLHCLMQSPRNKVGALVISPTRELAEQTSESFNRLGQYTSLRSLAIYGGVGMDAQIRGIKNGSEIIVACPGRLLDHIWKGNIDFPSLKILVIDEADRLFDMGFLPDIRRILECILQKHQTLLFSATMPDDIHRLVKEILTDPVTVQIGATQPARTVSHAIYPVNRHLKIELLEEILYSIRSESVLVFTKTKYRAESVASTLVKHGYKATSLQGNLTQSRRQAALTGFREGAINVLVATDIAARGIDVSNISHVINFDMPDCADDYIHRIGRTGRIGNNGEAFTLVTNEDAPMVRNLERLLKAPLERRTMENFNYNAHVPVHEKSGPSSKTGRNSYAKKPVLRTLFRRKRHANSTTRRFTSRREGAIA